jgi:hypothetical protein
MIHITKPRTADEDEKNMTPVETDRPSLFSQVSQNKAGLSEGDGLDPGGGWDIGKTSYLCGNQTGDASQDLYIVDGKKSNFWVVPRRPTSEHKGIHCLKDWERGSSCAHLFGD